MPGGTPYFPVSYCGEGGGRTFAVGLENDVLLADALAGAGAGAPGERLGALLRDVAGHVQGACRAAAGRVPGWTYAGLDPSIAPGIDSPSMVDAMEGLGLGRFGQSGSLAAAALVTAAVKSLPAGVATCGYAGLMFPVLEDAGLARAAAEGRVSVQKLLMWSAVCGTGLDTVPVPGRDPGGGGAAAEFNGRLHRSLTSVLLDVWSLSARLGKPLGCRLLPVSGGRPGRPVDFHSPFMVPGAVMDPGE